jgi:hypothetical protein
MAQTPLIQITYLVRRIYSALLAHSEAESCTMSQAALVHLGNKPSNASTSLGTFREAALLKVALILCTSSILECLNCSSTSEERLMFRKSQVLIENLGDLVPCRTSRARLDRRGDWALSGMSQTLPVHITTKSGC